MEVEQATNYPVMGEIKRLVLNEDEMLVIGVPLDFTTEQIIRFTGYLRKVLGDSSEAVMRRLAYRFLILYSGSNTFELTVIKDAFST